MKVYFYDGELPNNITVPKQAGEYLTIDAKYGHWHCEALARQCQEENKTVLTNYTYLLSVYGWNEKKSKWEVWIWISKQKKWRNIHSLVDRDLRGAHNIEKMYRAGCFEVE